MYRLIFILVIIFSVCCFSSTGEQEQSHTETPKIETRALKDEHKIDSVSKVGKTTSDFKKMKLINQKVEFLLPESFDIMSEEMLSIKYPSNQRPTLVYTNEDGTINFAFNHTINEVKEKQLPEILPIFTQQFSNLYPQIQWFKKEVITVNGKSFIVMEFITPAADTRIYNLMYITELDGKMLMCSFNCMENQKAEWEPVAKQCLNSVKIK